MISILDRKVIENAFGVAAYRIGRNRIASDPEQVVNPKREMVNLARRSRREAIREDMVPREGSGRSVGPGSASRLIEYIQTSWRVGVASEHSESLKRAVHAFIVP